MTIQRRSFLRAIGGIAGVSVLSGCISELGIGDGGDGGSRAGIALAPDGMMGVWMDHIVNSTSILEDELADVGYEIEIDESWEDAALFASGQANFSTMSSLEAAQLGGQRKTDLVVFGRVHPQYMGWMVATGGEYDPNETGGAQESIDKLVENEARVGIGAWNGGHVPTDTITLDQVYGYKFAEEGGDFNVTTADYVAIPQLIDSGDLAAGSTSPEHGGARFMVSDPPALTHLFWGADIAREHDFGVPNLNSLVTTQKYWDGNQEAVKAFTSAFQQGVDWFLNDPKGIVLENDKYIEMLGAQNAEQAEFIIDWGINLEYSTDERMVYESVTMDSEAIEQDKAFINYSAGIGFVAENWEERVTFQEISL